MIALPIISIVLCFAYIIGILFKYGVPVSISETYYLLPTKWDWLFAAWTVATSVPFGLYWYDTAPVGLKWMPIVTMVAILMVGVSSCYKSGPKKYEGVEYIPTITKGDICEKRKGSLGKTIREFLKELWNKMKPSEFFKYGPARLIHYVNSLVAIIITTIYLCMVCGKNAVASMLITYVVFVLIGVKTDGVYNKDYSADVDNKAWIFFMEIVCLINVFVFII